MKITQFSIRNPLVIAALTLALVCFGIYTYFNLSISLFPSVSFPEVFVTTSDPGADPATIETEVTKPIEDAVAGLPNIDTVHSTSSEGLSTVDVQFTTAADPNLVAVDVERAVSSARSKLPTEAESPSVTKIDLGAIPVIRVALSGPQPLNELKQVATDQVQRVFEAVPGVGSVQTLGGPAREVQVKVDLAQLQGRGIGLNTIQQALQSEQVEVPAGLLDSNGKEVNVRLNALVSNPSQLSQIVISRTQNGGIVHLGDVATIEDASKKSDTLTEVDGVPAVTLVVTKQAAANTLEVSRGIRQAINQTQGSLPQGMTFAVTYDAATYTQQSFNTIQKTLLEAILLTGLILLLFLHTWRSTAIVLVAIPTSVLTTFVAMKAMGYNLNLMSMLALTLAVGILVDDSIVVLENIYRHIGLREPPIVAAVNGRSEIGLAAITITMVDVAVYVPIALITGVAGDFIRPFALVIAASTLTSLAVSFTLTPLLASRFLHAGDALSGGRGPLAAFGRAWDRGFDVLAHFYRRVLGFILTASLIRFGFIRSALLRATGGRLGRSMPTRIGMRWGAIGFGFATLFLGLGLVAAGLIGFDFFPSGDQSEVDLTLQMPPATALQTTYQTVQQMEQTLRTIPEVRGTFSITGSAGTGVSSGGDTAFIFVFLKPKAERTRSAAELATAFRQSVSAPTGGRLVVALPNAFGFGGFGGQPIQVAVRGPDPNVLNPLVEQVTAAVKTVPGATEVNNINEQVRSEEVFVLDRARAADLGVTAQEAAGVLRTAIDGTVVAQYRQPGQDSVDIRLMSADQFRASPDNLAGLPLVTSRGVIVRLGQLGSVVSGAAPTQIQRVDRERTVVVNASASGRLSGDVQRDVETAVGRVALPPGYSVKYQGSASEGASSFGDLFQALGIAAILMYMLMLILFGSITLPLSVLMSAPLAVVGSLGAMALTGTPFTIFSVLGFAILLGLVGKNAILLVDYTDTLRKHGVSRTQALLEAGPVRLRPILMTTLSIVCALMPVVAGVEEGSELLKAAAVVLIGGLLTSTLLTLVFVPAMYTVFDDIQLLIGRLVARFAGARQLEPAEVAILHPVAPTPSNGVGHLPAAEPTDGVHGDRRAA